MAQSEYNLDDKPGCRILGRDPEPGDLVIVRDITIKSQTGPYTDWKYDLSDTSLIFVVGRCITADKNSYRVEKLPGFYGHMERDGIYIHADIAIPSLLVRLMLEGERGITRQLIDTSIKKYGKI